MDWLRWWYNHMAHVVPPSAVLAFVAKMSEKCKSSSPSAIQVKNWWKTVSIEEKLGEISWLEKGEQIVDSCHNITCPHISVCTIADNADRITEGAKSGSKVFV